MKRTILKVTTEDGWSYSQTEAVYSIEGKFHLSCSVAVNGSLMFLEVKGESVNLSLTCVSYTLYEED